MFQPEATDLAKILDFDASTKDSVNLARTKGSKHASKIKILMPLPLTRWNPPGAKAANMLKNQDFATSAIDPMKPTKIKGSKHAQNQDFDASAIDPMKPTKTKGSKHAQ